jgi:ankyrin repeat protein
MVWWLVSCGGYANDRASGVSRQSALHNAGWNGDLDMVKLLVDHGADLHARDGEHDATPRGWAETAITITNNPDCAGVAAWLTAQGG